MMDQSLTEERHPHRHHRHHHHHQHQRHHHHHHRHQDEQVISTCSERFQSSFPSSPDAPRPLNQQTPSSSLPQLRYIQGDKIGEGAYGTVYRAIDATLGGAVALKRIAKHRASTPTSRQLFGSATSVRTLVNGKDGSPSQIEGDVLMSLPPHKNVCKLLDSFEDNIEVCVTRILSLSCLCLCLLLHCCCFGYNGSKIEGGSV